MLSPNPRLALSRRALASPTAILLCALAGAQSTTTGGAGGSATPTAVFSDAAHLFDPLGKLALSRFRPIAPLTTATLRIDPSVRSWAESTDDLAVICRNAGGAITYLPSGHWVSTASGVRITAPANSAGTIYVAVHDGLGHDLPVVTHWDASANPSTNGPRGGFALGASDGISQATLDLTTGDPVFMLGIGDSSGRTIGGKPYVYRNDLALFSDGSEHGSPGTGIEFEEVPDAERFIAETWSLYSIDPLLVLRLSDRIRAWTGHPAISLNQGAALQHLDNVPCFQFLHAYLVDIDVSGDAYPGGYFENSIATFVLPPHWTAAAAEDSYPLLTNGHYDLHAATFRNIGEHAALALDRASGPCVAALWNGGGAVACQTMHPSARDNYARLVDVAADELRSDRERIVAVGGSRGGTTALLMGSNLRGEDYAVRYIIAENPQVRQSESLWDYGDPSRYIIQSTMDGFVGIHEAVEPGWIIPIPPHRTAPDQSAWVSMGTANRFLVEQLYEATAPTQAQALAGQLYGLVLRSGTHDTSHPMHQHVEYAAQMRALGLPVRHEIAYRSGHDPFPTTEPDLGWSECLSYLVQGNVAGIADETIVLVPSANGYVEANRPSVPFMIEMPFDAREDQDFSVVLAGPPMADYEIEFTFPGGSTATVSGTLGGSVGAGPTAMGFDFLDRAALEAALARPLVASGTQNQAYPYRARYKEFGSTCWNDWLGGSAAANKAFRTAADTTPFTVRPATSGQSFLGLVFDPGGGLGSDAQVPCTGQ